ncbi:MAG TPA: pitrilysin family protein [Blastocatellia bacterium]|nr:pitrilysin family protein [Blastocatellia bacterium]
MRGRLIAGLAAAGIVLGLTTVTRAQQTIRPPRLEIVQFTLPNGLRVVALEDHSAPIVNVQVWYHVGSRDERPGRTGFAHLFEHLMFKGSANVKPQEHAQRISDMGGILNAGTNFDYTFYWETVPSNGLEQVLWLESDRMATLLVDQANLDSERQVVIEELRLRVENPPYGRLGQIVFDTAFTKHSYKWMPIGSKADLDAATLEDVRAFHDTYYKPNNATIVVVGDFNLAALKASTSKYFGEIPKGTTAIPRPAQPEPAQTAERRVTNYDSKTPLPAAILAYHVPGQGDPDTYPLEVASRILSGGDSSRLYQRMVYEKQVALQASGSSFFLEDSGLFFFFAVMNAGKEASVGEAELVAEIDRLKNEPVTAAELEKAKTTLIAEVATGRLTNQEKADAIGAAATVLNNPAYVNEELPRYQSVTAADIQRVARKYLTVENRSVIYMLPESMRPAGDKPAAQGGQDR